MICNIAFSELPTDETSRAQCGQTLRGHGNVTDLTEVTVINIELVKCPRYWVTQTSPPEKWFTVCKSVGTVGTMAIGLVQNIYPSPA